MRQIKNNQKIAVLTSEGNWFVPYAKELVKTLNCRNYESNLFYKHEEINEDFEIVFILSYGKIIEKTHLVKHKHNVVVHGSDLPKGRGWAPIFWQILEGKNSIPLVLFEASEKIDAGDIYLKDYINLTGTELNEEIRKKQAEKTIELCLQFLEELPRLTPRKQTGAPTFYKKRTPKDSELNIDKSIKDQFNFLRIADNNEFPAFFWYKNCKYVLKIFNE